MMGISNYLENELLDHCLDNAAFTSPTNVYISLHTGDPGETGANECTGGSYARQTGSFAAASSGTSASDAAFTFTSMPGCTVTHIGIWDASSGGNFLFGGSLTASKVVGSGDTFEIASGDLTVTLD
jgi:hypothetical protein